MNTFWYRSLFFLRPDFLFRSQGFKFLSFLLLRFRRRIAAKKGNEVHGELLVIPVLTEHVSLQDLRRANHEVQNATKNVVLNEDM